MGCKRVFAPLYPTFKKDWTSFAIGTVEVFLKIHFIAETLIFSLTYEGLSNEGQVPSQCIPLYSLLLACGSPTVNYFRYSRFQVTGGSIRGL